MDLDGPNRVYLREGERQIHVGWWY
jgi:hypothetical protein